MVVAADNIFLSISVLAAFLLLVLMGRAKGQRAKFVLGGVGVAAGIIALALLADKFMSAP